MSKPFAHSLGPRPARIAFVGEAWGSHEELFRVPLVWYSGVELARMLSEVGLTGPFYDPRGQIEPYMISHWQTTGHFFTNVFAEHPPGDKLEEWCVKKGQLPEGYTAPYYKAGKYFLPDKLHHLERLFTELAEVKPTLIVTLGYTPAWAILQTTRNISSLRGAVAWSTRANCKVLPTFHPAYVLRNWSIRTIVLQDLLKAKREAQFPEIRRPQRWIITDPSLEDIRLWSAKPATHYAVDIETYRGQITMIGFARSRSDILVVPFLSRGKSFWPSRIDEVRAWGLVKGLLEGPQVKIFQNGLYDLSYISRMGIRPKNCTEDTMLLHHSLFPEMRKGLEFLGSIYTDELSWKLMRQRPKDQMLKREE